MPVSAYFFKAFSIGASAKVKHNWVAALIGVILLLVFVAIYFATRHLLGEAKEDITLDIENEQPAA